MKMRLITAALVAALAVFAVACADDGDDTGGNGNEPTPTAPSGENPQPTPTRPPAGTAPQQVQEAIDAALAGDADALAGMVRYSRIGCIAEPQGAGAPPICEEGEEEGTILEVLPAAQCEGFYIRRADVADELERFVEGGLEDYAVYNTPERYFPPGPFSAVFNGTNEGGATVGREIIVDANGVVGLNFGCSGDASDLVETRGLTDAIVEPD